MIADVMTVLRPKNFPLLKALVRGFLAILDTLLHCLVLSWVCKASQTRGLLLRFSPVPIIYLDILIFVEVILQGVPNPELAKKFYSSSVLRRSTKSVINALVSHYLP